LADSAQKEFANFKRRKFEVFTFRAMLWDYRRAGLVDASTSAAVATIEGVVRPPFLPAFDWAPTAEEMKAMMTKAARLQSR
jgi:hypothetical protein